MRTRRPWVSMLSARGGLFSKINVYHHLMMFIFKPLSRFVACSALSVFLASCGKSLPVPREVIDAALKRSHSSMIPVEYIAGETLISGGQFGILGKPVYPIRVIYMRERELPVKWDKDTGLPRLPPEIESARAYVEHEFTQNEFGEWSQRFRTLDWIDPAPEPEPDSPQPNDYGYESRFRSAALAADLDHLNRLLTESQQQDRRDDNLESYETTVRRLWIAEVSEIKQKARQEEELRLEQEVAQMRRMEAEEEERLAAQQRLEEQAKQQRNWERLLREVREEQKAAQAKVLPPAPDPQVEAQVQAEVEEALRFVNTSLMNRDGHTVDEFLKMKEWSYSAKVHEAVKQALQEAEDQYVAQHGNSPESREEFRNTRKEEKARRYRQAEQDPEYRKMKAGQPFENGYRAFHYWMPVEFSASRKPSR